MEMTHQERVADLERRLAEVKTERDEARDLMRRMEEQVAAGNAVIEQWIEAFDMQLGDKGWTWNAFVDRHHALAERHTGLLRHWNRFVSRYNAQVAPKEIGRPLDASLTQVRAVLKLRESRASLRSIADETNLSLKPCAPSSAARWARIAHRRGAWSA